MVTSSTEGQTPMDRVQALPATQNSHLFLSGPHLTVQCLMEPLRHNHMCQSQLDFLSHQQPQYPATTAGFNNTPVWMWQDLTHSTKMEPGVSMSCPQLHSLGHGPNHLHLNLGDCSKLPFFKINKCVSLKNYHLENDITRSMCSWALSLRKYNLKRILWLLVQWVAKTK